MNTNPTENQEPEMPKCNDTVQFVLQQATEVAEMCLKYPRRSDFGPMAKIFAEVANERLRMRIEEITHPDYEHNKMVKISFKKLIDEGKN